MKSAMLMMFVAVAALVTMDSAVMAGGPSGGTPGGKDGGGKVASSARVVFNNTDDGAVDQFVWVRATGTELPETVGELRAQLTTVNAGATNVRTDRLTNGNYDITVLAVADTAGVEDDDLLADLIGDEVPIDESIVINGEDLEFDIDAAGNLTLQEDE